MSSVQVSIVIPAYNRVDRLKLTLASVADAIDDVSAEVLVVDDGSEPALKPDMFDELPDNVRIIRQANQGSIIARHHGLMEARGEYVQFLDSDDCITPDKLKLQLKEIEAHGLDTAYCDYRADSESGEQRLANTGVTDSGYELCLWIQPPPHSAVYRRELLLAALAEPVIPPLRCFDPTGDTWLYFNLSLGREFSTKKLDAHLAICNIYESDRYSLSWERLGLASLGLMWCWADWTERHQPDHPGRGYIAHKAFLTWLCLPNGCKKWHADKVLETWRKCGAPPFWSDRLRQTLVSVFGEKLVGEVLRKLRRPAYQKIKTIENSEYEERIAELKSVMAEFSTVTAGSRGANA